MYSKRDSAGQPRTGRAVSLLVASSHPSNVAASTTVGGALTLICPTTGSIQSSTRIQGGDLQHSTNHGQVGVSSLSMFPRQMADGSSSSSLAIAYGSSTVKRRGNDADDSYGMLFTIRRTAGASPILHWKCRLPEPNMSGGLLASPVSSRHVIGGGATGTLYVWDALQGGSLVRTVPSAHYRAITCMIWSAVDPNVRTSPWNAMLCTGGADGMVHAFSQIDLVEQPSMSMQGSESSVHPIRTWSKHHLAVTALVAMNGGRIASVSEDGQIIIMELCSGSVVATIQLPDAIQSLCTDAHHGRRLFAGSVKGMIHAIDLDSFALHCTIQMGATIVPTPKDARQTSTLADRVFGSSDLSGKAKGSDSEDSSVAYQSTLRGHDRAVTSLAVYEEANDGGGSSTEYVVSGDESGVVRIWDSRRACCIRVISAWASSSSSADGTTTTTKGGNAAPVTTQTVRRHPVTSISILRDETNPFEKESVSDVGAMFGSKRRKIGDSFLSMISPLQKFSSLLGDGDQSTHYVPIPFVEPRRTDDNGFWDLSVSRIACERALLRRSKLRRSLAQSQSLPLPNNAAGAVDAGDELRKKCDEVESLEKELDLAKETIARWEVVNNKLMSKLRQEER